jgi:DNA-binding beta-propeller fold protein YncE
MSKRHSKLFLLGFGLLGLVFALTMIPVFLFLQTTHAGGPAGSGLVLASMTGQQKMTKMTTINGLGKITEIGSTAFILDAQNNTIAVDPNPYDVAVFPANTPSMPNGLKAGDLVVTNFGANQTGTTLVRFSGQNGPGHLFNTMTNGTKGPADEAFNTMTGTDWVANMGANNIEVFTSNGRLQQTITNPMFKQPWGMTSNHGLRNAKDGAVGAFFTSNAATATIDRIEILPAAGGTRFQVTQIGQLTQMGKQTFIAMKWVASLQVQGKKFSDVLVALDPAKNRIAAFPNSSTSAMNKTSAGMTIFQGKSLNTPGGLAINPINGDLLVVNGGDNNLVEINPSQGKVVGTRALDNVPVNPKTGNGSALFGVAATTDAKGNLEIFFTDDNTNTLNALQAS